jgi:integrase
VQGSRTQAQRELRSLADFANVGPSIGARTTLGELLDRWFAANQADWATTTVRSTWSIIDRQLRPKLGHVLVRDLNTVTIDEFYASLRVDGAVEGGPLTPGSVRRIHGVLHRALAQAMRWEWIWSNPAANATPPRAEPVEMRPPSPQQVGELLDHVRTLHPLLHLFLILAATTGARRGQLLALKWADVDFEHTSLSFQRAWVEGPNGPVLAPTKTRRSHRVALDPYTQHLLEEQWDRICPVAIGDLDGAFVFSREPFGERPWNPNWVTKQFIRHRRAAGIEHFRLHDLRHFMATQMLGSGIAVPVVSARLAHARASTTLNVYAHAIPGTDVEAACLISGILRKPALRLTSAPSPLRAEGAAGT